MIRSQERIKPFFGLDSATSIPEFRRLFLRCSLLLVLVPSCMQSSCPPADTVVTSREREELVYRTATCLRIKDADFDGFIELTPLRSQVGYRLAIVNAKTGESNQLRIGYPVFRFDVGDVDRDRHTDILLGVIKRTHFDPTVQKRLFLFSVVSGHIVPLWFGSRVCQQLLDFKYAHLSTPGKILTIEQRDDKQFTNGVYSWDNFGLVLDRYINENSTYAKALDIFNHEGTARSR